MSAQECANREISINLLVGKPRALSGTGYLLFLRAERGTTHTWSLVIAPTHAYSKNENEIRYSVLVILQFNEFPIA